LHVGIGFATGKRLVKITGAAEWLALRGTNYDCTNLKLRAPDLHERYS
jgi:hypothetical protein